MEAPDTRASTNSTKWTRCKSKPSPTHACIRAWGLQGSAPCPHPLHQAVMAVQPDAVLGLTQPLHLWALSKMCTGPQRGSKRPTWWCVGKAHSSVTGNATGLDLQHRVGTKSLLCGSNREAGVPGTTTLYRMDGTHSLVMFKCI